MNTRSSSYTGRAARTLRDAFGPYTSHALQPMPDTRPRPWVWIAVYATAAIVVTVILNTGA